MSVSFEHFALLLICDLIHHLLKIQTHRIYSFHFIYSSHRFDREIQQSSQTWFFSQKLMLALLIPIIPFQVLCNSILQYISQHSAVIEANRSVLPYFFLLYYLNSGSHLHPSIHRINFRIYFNWKIVNKASIISKATSFKTLGCKSLDSYTSPISLSMFFYL